MADEFDGKAAIHRVREHVKGPANSRMMSRIGATPAEVSADRKLIASVFDVMAEVLSEYDRWRREQEQRAR